MEFGSREIGSAQGLAEIERNQDALRHCIEEAKRLAEDSQFLLDRSSHSGEEPLS